MWLYVTLTSVLTSDHDDDAQHKEGEEDEEKEEEGEEAKAPSGDIDAKENIGNAELRQQVWNESTGVYHSNYMTCKLKGWSHISR